MTDVTSVGAHGEARVVDCEGMPKPAAVSSERTEDRKLFYLYLCKKSSYICRRLTMLPFLNHYIHTVHVKMAEESNTDCIPEGSIR